MVTTPPTRKVDALAALLGIQANAVLRHVEAVLADELFVIATTSQDPAAELQAASGMTKIRDGYREDFLKDADFRPLYELIRMGRDRARALDHRIAELQNERDKFAGLLAPVDAP